MSCTNCPEPFELCIEEGGEVDYQATLLDKAGGPVPLVAITDLTLTLTNKASGTVINSRASASVKNTGGGTYHATSGLFTMTFAAADNPIVNAAKSVERHIATFQATWSGGGAKNWEVIVSVRNLVGIVSA